MDMLVESKPKTYYFDAKDPECPSKLGNELRGLINLYRLKNQPIIILCIGTDRSTGDSLGPLVGYKLSKYTFHNSHIYGTLDVPIHAINIYDSIKYIEVTHSNPFVIAIDASLGSNDHIGYITMSASPLRPGLGVKKSLPEIGNISITGIVNFSGLLDTMLLQSTRLSTVMQLADCISLGLLIALP